MALQAHVQVIRAVGPLVEVWGRLAASGNYTNGVGGDTVNFNTATLDPSFSGPAVEIAASQAPVQFDVGSQGGQNQYVYTANLANATSPANAQVKVSASATLNSELATGAYPAAITGDNIAFYAAFKKLQ